MTSNNAQMTGVGHTNFQAGRNLSAGNHKEEDSHNSSFNVYVVLGVCVTAGVVALGASYLLGNAKGTSAVPNTSGGAASSSSSWWGRLFG
jgi:hypothetical protein